MRSHARRILSLWLPRLSSDLALRRRPVAGPFALVGRTGGADRLNCINEAAQASGLTRGMGVADARAICPGLATRPADPQATAHGLAALRRWALNYCPWVGREGADGLVLDITGAAHLRGGEDILAQDMADRLTQMGLAARIGLADTRGAAWALARYGGAGGNADIQIAPSGDMLRLLGVLPLPALRLMPDTCAALDRLGLRTIRDLTRLPRATLARRFGQEVVLRLDQALGDLPEPISPDPELPHFGTRLSLPDPIGLMGDLQAGLARLLTQLCTRLAESGRGARQLRLELSRVDGCPIEIEIGLARPMRDPAAIVRLFEDALGHIDVGFGIDRMRLTAPETEPLSARQITSSGRAAQDDLDDLLTRMCNRLGFENVQRLMPTDSHIPEKAFHAAAAAYCDAATDWSGPTPGSRPLTLFAPEPVTLHHLGRPPLAFQWRGQRHRCLRAAGPERIAPEWWMDDPAWRSGLRDYWRVQTDTGARLWLFHTPLTGNWCVQGIFA